MKNSKVQLQILEYGFTMKESQGTVTKIMVKNNMPKLFQIQTESGTYYRRENELKFIK